ncbi:MAG: hypothetical protein ABFQ64_07815 [Campylobacterota bacterium]
MIDCKESDTVEDEVTQEYDYMNEEPLEEESDLEYEKEENDYCD